MRVAARTSSAPKSRSMSRLREEWPVELLDRADGVGDGKEHRRFSSAAFTILTARWSPRRLAAASPGSREQSPRTSSDARGRTWPVARRARLCRGRGSRPAARRVRNRPYHGAEVELVPRCQPDLRLSTSASAAPISTVTTPPAPLGWPRGAARLVHVGRQTAGRTGRTSSRTRWPLLGRTCGEPHPRPRRLHRLQLRRDDRCQPARELDGYVQMDIPVSMTSAPL